VSLFWSNISIVLIFIQYFVIQGLEYLISNNLLNNTPEDIADFLFREEGLNKTMIGNYLGEK